MTTCVFPLGGEAEVQPGWPAHADLTLLVLEGAKVVALAAVREVRGPER